MDVEEHTRLVWKFDSYDSICSGNMWLWGLALNVAVFGWDKRVTVRVEDLPEEIMDHALTEMKIWLP